MKGGLPARHMFGDDGPLISECLMKGEEFFLFGLGPDLLGDAGHQMIIPSLYALSVPLPALLPRSPLEAALKGQSLGDHRPILRLVFLRQLGKGLVFLRLEANVPCRSNFFLIS